MVSTIKHRHRLHKSIILIIILLCGCFLSSTSFAQSSDYVRVAILQDVPSFNLKIRGNFQILDAESGEVLYQSKNLKTIVTVYQDGISMLKINLNTDKVYIKASLPEAIMINARRFRGDLKIIKKKNLKILVINNIDLEDYIKGVLYHEVSHHWPLEALKAQAIASRTFAFYQMKKNRLKDYDLTSDIYSQVYGGRISERYRTNRAVEDTQDKILTFRDEVFPAYYHATCAGHTQDASRLWDIDIEPLKGLTCSFCKNSPHYKWHRVLSHNLVRDKLKNKGYKIDNIEDILILGRDESARVTNLKIITNEDVEISGKDFRNILGPNIIRSTNFKISVVNEDIVLEGFGWGHGVGLCQWGAYFMAREGYNYQEVLKYYYPKTGIILISDLK